VKKQEKLMINEAGLKKKSKKIRTSSLRDNAAPAICAASSMPHDYNEDNGNDNDAYDEAPTSTRD
jgi:hypothetical protein